MGNCIIKIPEIKGESNMIIFSNSSDTFVSYLLTPKEIILHKLFSKGTNDLFTWVEEVKKATEAPNYCSWNGYNYDYKSFIKDSDTKSIKKIVKTYSRVYSEKHFLTYLKTAVNMIKASPVYYNDTLSNHREYLQFLNECGLEELAKKITPKIKQ